MNNDLEKLMICAAVFLLSVSVVIANPSGAQVIAGSANVGSSGSTLTVNQSSNRAIVNWQSFSIAQGELTKFIQPSSSSAILNRVIGSNLSQLDGMLQANGQVYLINPNGVIIGQSGVISTAGFLASTLDVSNSEFLAGGDLHFSGNSTAMVQNLGQIDVAGGDVYLIAQKVENGGEINASDGVVGLAGGNQVLLTQAGNEHLLVDASGSGCVSNTATGEINAISAKLKAAGGNMFALAINNGGTIRATGVAEKEGRILLIAEEGAVKNTGTLYARNSDGSGGFVETSGKDMNVTGSVDVGEGGLWLIDPDDLIIDAARATTIMNTLNGGGDVTEQTTAGGVGGNGDITVNAAITWDSTATLTLDAYNDLAINKSITMTDGKFVAKALGHVTIDSSAKITSGGNGDIQIQGNSGIGPLYGYGGYGGGASITIVGGGSSSNPIYNSGVRLTSVSVVSARVNSATISIAGSVRLTPLNPSVFNHPVSQTANLMPATLPVGGAPPSFLPPAATLPPSGQNINMPQVGASFSSASFTSSPVVPGALASGSSWSR